jgi:hypothetical protein
MDYAEHEGGRKRVVDTDIKVLNETLQELVQRLAPLAGAMANTAQLRVTQTTVPSTAVTGPMTSAQSIAEKNVGGVMYTTRVATENIAAVQSNINNVVITT